MEGCKVSSVFSLVLLVAGVWCMDDEMAELAKMIRDNCGAESEVDMALIDKVRFRALFDVEMVVL